MLQINTAPLCIGYVSKSFSVDNIKKTGLYGYIYKSSVDYNSVYVGDILDVHKYLMKKPNIYNI